MQNTSIKFEITLTEDQVKTLNQLLATRRNVSMDALIQQCLDKGIKDTHYRTERNKRVYQETKQIVAMYKQQR